MHFKKDLVDGITQDAFNRSVLLSTRNDAELRKRLDEAVMGMSKEYSQREPGFEMAILRGFLDISIAIVRSDAAYKMELGKESVGNDDKDIERVCAWLIKNYDDADINQEMAAEVVNMSASQLSHAFSDKTGILFNHYLSGIRIKHARELLSTTDDAVIDIAYAVGFNSLDSFNRQFKSITGTTPLKYRNGYRG
jgi:AraC-like DNA-binding protein